MELQLVFEVWDSLDELNGRCLKQLGAKRTSQMSYGTQVAAPALFCQRNVISSYGMFWGSSTPDSSSKGWEKSVQTLCVSWSMLVFKFSSFGQISCFWSKKVEVICNRLMQAIQHPLTSALSPPNQWICLAARDLALCSRIMVLA